MSPADVANLELERDILRSLAEIGRSQGFSDAPLWHSLRSQVDSTQVRVSDPLAVEATLEECALEIRRLLLRRGHAAELDQLRSPDLEARAQRPSGPAAQHSYERNVPLTQLENRVADDLGAPPEGWDRSVIAFRSGMSALSHVFTSLAHMMQPSEVAPLVVSLCGDYFETDLLLEYLTSSSFCYKKCSDSQTLDALARGDVGEVLVVEPVRYNWTLDVLSLPGFLKAWSESARPPSVLVIDSTLTAPLLPTKDLLHALAKMRRQPLVLEVRSALKLDQQGLEVSNLGLVIVHSHSTAPAGVPTGEALATTLRLARGTTGSGLPLSDLVALDVPFLLSGEWTRLHSGRVFVNNRRLAEDLADVKGLFSHVAHPSLADQPTAGHHAPFVVVHLEEDTLENHGLLLAALRYECRVGRLTAAHGSSFGFRSHRFETIIPRVARQQGLFKVCAGARSGPSLNQLTGTLRNLGRHKSFEALRKAYPTLQPVPLR